MFRVLNVPTILNNEIGPVISHRVVVPFWTQKFILVTL